MVVAEPEIVLTHGPCFNPDHGATRILAYSAFKLADGDVPLGRCCVRVTSPEGNYFPMRLVPDWLVDVSGHEDTVIEAVNKHVSQCQTMDRNEGLRRNWRTFADRIPEAEYVEAWQIIARGRAST